MLFHIHKGFVNVTTDYIQPNDTLTRGSQRLCQLQATKVVYKYSFYPCTISDWNRLPTSVTNVQTLQEFREGLSSQSSLLMRPYSKSINMYIVLTRDVGNFICFIGHRSFMHGNRQSKKISTLTMEEEELFSACFKQNVRQIFSQYIGRNIFTQCL